MSGEGKRRSRSGARLRSVLLPRLVQTTALLPIPLVLRSRPLFAAALRRVPGWRDRVQRSMAAALGPDGFDPAHVDGYFRHLSDLLAYSLAVFRRGVHGAALDQEWWHEPASRETYAAALEGGRGALMVCPHLVGHEIMAGTTTLEVPLTVLVRKAPDPRYEALKQRWYSALGVEVVYRPQKGSEMEGLAEITTALRALRKNRVLALTPDLLQRPGSGVPVRLFGRQAELPAGPFFLAARTGAPLLPSFFHQEESRYRLWTHEPLTLRTDADRDTVVAAAAQEWAALFEEFVRAHPDMWQFWLDKRWCRWWDAGA